MALGSQSLMHLPGFAQNVVKYRSHLRRPTSCLRLSGNLLTLPGGLASASRYCGNMWCRLPDKLCFSYRPFQCLLRPLSVKALAVQINGPLVFPLHGLHVVASSVESPPGDSGRGPSRAPYISVQQKKPPRLAEGRGGLFFSGALRARSHARRRCADRCDPQTLARSLGSSW